MAQIEEFVMAVDRLDSEVNGITRRRSNILKSIGESETVSDVNTLDEVSLQTSTSDDDEDTSVSKLKGGKVLDMNDSSHGTTATTTDISQSSDSESSSSENLEVKHINTDANKSKEDTMKTKKNVKPMKYIRKESLEHQISSLELGDTDKMNELQYQRSRTRTYSTVSVTSSSNGGDSLTNKEEDTNKEDTFKHWKDMGWLVGFEN